jgi:sugar lactone lactonase YvrE
VDSSGIIYVSDTNNDTIRKITSGGVVTTVAGLAGVTSVGSTDAIGTAAKFNSPWDIDIDAAGNLYVADRGNNLIRKLTNSSGTYTASTIAGTAGSSGSTDGTGSAARFNAPTGLAVDASGNIFVTDTGNNTIRRLAYVPPTTITIEVDGTDSATVSAPLAATTVHKTGAGTSVLSGNNSSVSTLSIDAGLVKVAATNNMGASLAFAGGNMEVTSGTVAVPTAAVNAAATITTDSGAAVSSIAAPSGSALLTLAGSGVITAGDMSASATPLSIPGVMHVGASSSSKMPTGVATVPSGGLVKIMGNTASSVPGATQLQSGAVLEVADSIAVPAHTGADIFGTLKFDSGASLKLGVGSTWARNISVGTAL